MNRLILTAIVFFSPFTVAATEYIEQSGTHSVKCVCVVASSSFCGVRDQHELARSPLHTWYTDVQIPQGGALIDLNDACYKQRSAYGQGNAMCCDIGSQRKNRFYKGLPVPSGSGNEPSAPRLQVQ